MTRAETENAANPRQTRGAERRARRRRRRFEDALRRLLDTPDGQLVFGERRIGLLARCRTFATVYSDSSLRMAYNAGRQDVGHELMALLAEVSEEAYVRMEAECRALERRDDQETEAALMEGGEE